MEKLLEFNHLESLKSGTAFEFVAYKLNKELYQETDAKIAEKFGRDSKAYKIIRTGINLDKGTGSSFLWNNEVNLCLPKEQIIMDWKDLQGIYNVNPTLFKGHYSDSLNIILRSDIPSWDNNREFLNSLVEQVKGDFSQFKDFSNENPIVLSGIESVKDDNSENFYGLLPRLNEKTKIQYDSRFVCSKEKIIMGDITKKLLRKRDGLSGIFAGGLNDVNSDDGNLSGSNNNGWIIVVEKKN